MGNRTERAACGPRQGVTAGRLCGARGCLPPDIESPATVARVGEPPLIASVICHRQTLTWTATIHLLATASLHPCNNAPAIAGRRLAGKYVPAMDWLVPRGAWRHPSR